MRLHRYPVLHEIVRLVGQRGRNEIDFWDWYRDMAGRYSLPRPTAPHTKSCVTWIAPRCPRRSDLSRKCWRLLGRCWASGSGEG